MEGEKELLFISLHFQCTSNADCESVQLCNSATTWSEAVTAHKRSSEDMDLLGYRTFAEVDWMNCGKNHNHLLQLKLYGTDLNFESFVFFRTLIMEDEWEEEVILFSR